MAGKRIDWSDVSDEVEAATGRQCKWVDGELWMRAAGTLTWTEVPRKFKNAAEARAYVCGLIDGAPGQ